VLVDYLRERQPSVDFSSLQRFAYLLGKLFWADLEAHHPGIDSVAVVADQVLVQHAAEMGLVDDEDPVEELSA